MKVRISENSLRFRLLPEDCALLKEKGQVSLNLQLSPEQAFSFSLILQGSDPVLHVAGPSFVLRAPEAVIRAWIDSKEMSWEYNQEHPPLSVLVEKDAKPHRQKKL